MIFNLKDNDMNNYITWVYGTLMGEINGINERIVDTGWVSLELLNGAKLFTAGYDLQVRRIGNTVYMRGRITGLTAHPTTIAVLPQQFRPRDGYSFRFVVPSNGGTNAVFVFNPDSGNVILDFTSDGNVPAERWFSFNNVVFCTD
jgi:hypothetical protein